MHPAPIRCALSLITLPVWLALPACAMESAGDPPPGPGSEASVDPALWPEAEWPLEPDPALETRIDALLRAMTVEEKVGQIIQADISSVTPEDVRSYHLGSILAGGNSSPGGRYNASPQEWLELADAFYEASMDTGDGAQAIPVLFGIDAVHGHNNVVGTTLFPHNIGLGAARNPDLLEDIGRITAIEARVTGMDWTFAPSVAVPQDLRWGRTYEGYSERPEIVAAYADRLVEGLQGRPGESGFLGPDRVLATVKHFIGDGGTTDGVDQGDTDIPESELRDIHNAGYPPAIAAGVQTVMASFNSYQGRKLHGHRGLLNDVLKARMNFGGFVVGDWNGHGQVDGCSNTDCPASLNAGLDMFMAPDSWKGLYETTLAQAKSGAIPAERLDDAVARILRVKLRLGLFEAGAPSGRPLGGDFDRLAAPEHRAVARKAVRQSLVLLKNNDGLLPLHPGRRILVAGDGADNLGKQTGGWSLTWQGTGTTRADFPHGETIWEGLRDHVEAGGGEAQLATDGTYDTRPDAAVVVFGEDPYAEFQGDLPTLQYHPGDDRDLDLLRKLAADDIPVVAVYLGGRPLWLNREINAADAFVAAWLPGSEGGGAADVLLADADGNIRHDFSGRLSFGWPQTAVDYDRGPDADPLFPYGYGLTYDDREDLGTLPEHSGVAGSGLPTGVWFSRGIAADDLTLRLVGTDGRIEPVTRSRTATADGNLELVAVDHQAQEDARRLSWSGPARVELAAGTPLDIGRETNGDVLLTLALSLISVPPAGDILLRAGCGDHCTASLPVGAWFRELPDHQWMRIGVPLKCLRTAGADMQRLDVPFALAASAGLVVTLREIGLGTDVDERLDCATAP